MFDHRSTAYILSSSCPSSRSLVDFARRIGGILDPDFLIHCQITDGELQKAIRGLKQIPLNYDSATTSNLHDQRELFLDMDVSKRKQFVDPWQFKRYNAWLERQCHWNPIYPIRDDLIIDLI